MPGKMRREQEHRRRVHELIERNDELTETIKRLLGEIRVLREKLGCEEGGLLIQGMAGADENDESEVDGSEVEGAGEGREEPSC